MADSIQEVLIKTSVLESDLDHLSARVEKLCEQIDKSLPLLSEINLRMHDDIARRETAEAIIKKIVEEVKEIGAIQNNHDKIIKDNSTDIIDLKEIVSAQKSIVKASKFYWKFIGSIGAVVAFVSGSYYAYDVHVDRNADRAIRVKQAELDYQKSISDIEEKKKKLEYTREKYMIRNGVKNEERF